MFTPMILEFNDEKKSEIYPKKKDLLWQVCKNKMFHDRNILHMWQGQFVLIILYEHIRGLLFYLGDLMLKHVMCVNI